MVPMGEAEEPLRVASLPFLGQWTGSEGLGIASILYISDAAALLNVLISNGIRKANTCIMLRDS